MLQNLRNPVFLTAEDAEGAEESTRNPLRPLRCQRRAVLMTQRSWRSDGPAIISCLDSMLGFPYHRVLPQTTHGGWVPTPFTAVTRFG
jgi:hypothetical protein